MKIFIAAIAMLFVCSLKAATADSAGVINDTTAIVAVSDTLADDTSSYVISTTIPRGFMQSIQHAIDESSDHSLFDFHPFDGLGALFAAGGILLVVLFVGILFFPLAVLAFVVWLLVRNGRRAKKADMRRYAGPVYTNASEAPETTGSPAQGDARPNGRMTDGYTNRRDNAIRNIAVGAGLLVLFYFMDFSFGMDNETNADGSTRTDYSYQFAKRLWGNRVSIIVGGKVSSNNEDQNVGQTLIDNASIEYRLDKSATRNISLFYDRSYESLLEGEITEMGIGLILRRKMNRLGELFIFNRERNKNKPDTTDSKK